MTKIPGLVKWCASIAKQVADPTPFNTGIALDHFGFGQEIMSLPPETVVIAADWTEGLYTHPVHLTFEDPTGSTTRILLFDCDVTVTSIPVDPLNISFTLNSGPNSWHFNYTVAPIPRISYVGGPAELSVVRGFATLDVLDVITEESIRFHLADGSALQGSDLSAPLGEMVEPFDLAQATSIDWDTVQVDIRKEFGPAAGTLRSIHDWLGDNLVQSGASMVFYDHRTGECADFLALTTDDAGAVQVALYHCKGSGGVRPGDRVEDLYEACGQAIKSASYRSLKRLLSHVERRAQDGSQFLKGTIAEFAAALGADPRYELPLAVFIVQPGFARDMMSEKIGSLLTAVDRTLVSLGCHRLRVLCS